MKTKILPLLFLFFFVMGPSRSQAPDPLTLMPWPQDLKAETGFQAIRTDFTLAIQGAGANSRLESASTRFLRYLTDKTGTFLEVGYPLIGQVKNATLIIEIQEEAVLGLDNDESYELEIFSNGISLRAQTDIGALRGLSTLKQLISVQNGAYGFPQLVIKDAPRFPWRGLMLDVSRHFMPVEVVKRNLDAMAYVKLNVLHWHLSDDQGFRVEVKSLPNLHERASDGMYYTQEQIRDIVRYADERGIRVVPEFDVPGHATAILTAYPEYASNPNLRYSLERNSGIFDPTLDPTNDEVYTFLDILLKEVTPLFPDIYFHIGGDENEGKHWDENSQIQRFMAENEIPDNHELQTYFNIRLEKILNRYGKKLMGWEEIMTPNMPKTALIHSWRGVNEGMQPGESLIKAVKNGYQTILSNGYYIDLMLSVEDHYLVDPMPAQELTEEEQNRILGGEATMWSELVTPLTIDTRVWPRTAAIAERFWSPQDIRDLDDMHRRLNAISLKLEGLGIRHNQVREYLLRNVANYKDTGALRDLMQISEPLKIYTRNAGGTQYQVYSPFTLFADACTPDAIDARPFERAVGAYIESQNDSDLAVLEQYLVKWSTIYERLVQIEQDAPLVKPILPYAKRIREISTRMLEGLEEGKLRKKDFVEVQDLLEEQDDPGQNLDVELAVKKGILDLATFLSDK
jgi:hexosaminidase